LFCDFLDLFALFDLRFDVIAFLFLVFRQGLFF